MLSSDKNWSHEKYRHSVVSGPGTEIADLGLEKQKLKHPAMQWHMHSSEEADTILISVTATQPSDSKLINCLLSVQLQINMELVLADIITQVSA